MEAFSII